MCILFIYNGSEDVESEYSLIVASNRDEFYARPSQIMGPWSEDPEIIGGRDLGASCDSTWLAVAPVRNKLGVLLNLPRTPKPDAISRGRIVADFVRTDIPVKEYIDEIQNYVHQCNEFVFVAVDINVVSPTIQTYSNSNNELTKHTDTYLGFSNSLPDRPLKKTEAGCIKLKEICMRLNKESSKEELVRTLIEFLKSQERHLPDPEIMTWRPQLCEQLSSIFVSVPEGGYGTRAHTIILITKSGRVDVIESSLQEPIDVNNPNWRTTEFSLSVQSNL